MGFHKTREKFYFLKRNVRCLYKEMLSELLLCYKAMSNDCQ